MIKKIGLVIAVFAVWGLAMTIATELSIPAAAKAAIPNRGRLDVLDRLDLGVGTASEVALVIDRAEGTKFIVAVSRNGGTSVVQVK